MRVAFGCVVLVWNALTAGCVCMGVVQTCRLGEDAALRIGAVVVVLGVMLVAVERL